MFRLFQPYVGCAFLNACFSSQAAVTIREFVPCVIGSTAAIDPTDLDASLGQLFVADVNVAARTLSTDSHERRMLAENQRGLTGRVARGVEDKSLLQGQG